MEKKELNYTLNSLNDFDTDLASVDINKSVPQLADDSIDVAEGVSSVQLVITDAPALHCLTIDFQQGEAENGESEGYLIADTMLGGTCMTHSELTIDKNYICNAVSNVDKVVLTLTAKAGANGYIKINGNIYAAEEKTYKLDITNLFKNSNGNLLITIDPDVYTNLNSSSHVEFYTEGEYSPKLLIEATMQHHYKTIPLFGDAKVSIDLTMKNRYVLSLLDTMDGLEVYHVFKPMQTSEDYRAAYFYGKGTNLNVVERIVEDYTQKYYIDSFGDRYIISGGKVANMKYTETEPIIMQTIPEYQNMKGQWDTDPMRNKLPRCWIVYGSRVKGFNSDGYLTIFNDSKNNFLLCKLLSEQIPSSKHSKYKRKSCNY